MLVDFRSPLDAARSYSDLKIDTTNISCEPKELDMRYIKVLAYGLVRKMMAMVAIAGLTGTQFSGGA